VNTRVTVLGRLSLSRCAHSAMGETLAPSLWFPHLILLPVSPVCGCVGALAPRVGIRTGRGATLRRLLGCQYAEPHLAQGAKVRGLSGLPGFSDPCVLQLAKPHACAISRSIR